MYHHKTLFGVQSGKGGDHSCRRMVRVQGCVYPVWWQVHIYHILGVAFDRIRSTKFLLLAKIIAKIMAVNKRSLIIYFYGMSVWSLPQTLVVYFFWLMFILQLPPPLALLYILCAKLFSLFSSLTQIMIRYESVYVYYILIITCNCRLVQLRIKLEGFHEQRLKKQYVTVYGN